MNILNSLTVKHLKMNKKRTIVTIIGVILSTALMVGIGLLLSTFREFSIEEVISYEGDYHAKFLNIDSGKVDIIKNNTQVESSYSKEFVGSIKNENSDDGFKSFFSLFNADQNYLENLELISGRLPQNDSELVIPNHIEGSSYKVGDQVTFKIGRRFFEGTELFDDFYIYGESLEIIFEKTYTIVGIISKDIYEKSYEVGYNIFTKNEDMSQVMIYIKYKKPQECYKITEKLVDKLGLDINKISYNDSLLSLYGVSEYSNVTSGLISILVIMLSLVSIGCIIVIYNSFAISVMERKKQFGLLASIGATKKQIRKTVLFESFIVAILGIPLGIISSYVGIGTVIYIVNILLNEATEISFKLTTYPIFIVIPIIFMLITILLSAFMPARSASKISPIEAIRLNDDIKIKNKKLKTNKFIRKLFGIEGEIALKNIKRNKKKYRITIISLFISIVLFISFNSLMQYINFSINTTIKLSDYQIIINGLDNKELIDDIRNNSYVEESLLMSVSYDTISANLESMYSNEYKKLIEEANHSIEEQDAGVFIILSDEDFKKYLKKIHQTEEKPVLYSEYDGVIYSMNSSGNPTRKGYVFNRYKDNAEPVQIELCNQIYDDLKNETIKECYYKITDYYVSDETILGISSVSNSMNPVIIVSSSYYQKITEMNYQLELYIKTDNSNELDKLITGYIDNDLIKETQYFNLEKEYTMIKNLILVINILVYGFIALVTLIGVTSVFNTINTSVALRRKEFAVLRSIGLTPKGFNRMLRFESLFYGLKSLIYAIPASILVTWSIHISVSEFAFSRLILIPWNSILIAIIGVFIIITISMMYSTKKIKNENIIDTIREENI